MTDSSIMAVAESICICGMQNREVVDVLARDFKRDVRIRQTQYFGVPGKSTIAKRGGCGDTERLSIRFHSDMHDQLAVLAYAMDCTISRACARLIETCLTDPEFTDGFIHGYLNRTLEPERMKELERILHSIQAANACEEQEETWATFLSYIIDEAKHTTANVKKAVSEFVVHHWRG